MSPIDYVPTPPRSAEVVVIGGGVIGAATAFFAARAGLAPLLIERRPALCTLTTPASTGAFRLQFDNPEELALVRESSEVFLNFAEVSGQSDYDLKVRSQGYLWLTTDEARLERHKTLVERQHSWGQTDIELLSGPEVRARWPYVSDEVLGGRFRAGDGFIDPTALTMGLVAGSGARVAVSCGATGFKVAGGRLRAVETTAGTVSTEVAVIAAGPFAGAVASRAGVSLPIETVQRHKLVMPDVDLVPQDAPMTIDDDTGAHWRPALNGAFLLFTDPTTPPTPPAEVLPIDHNIAFQLLDPSSPVGVARVAPFWKRVWERNAAPWILQAGQYDMTPDHRPLLGPTPVEGLYVNCGYSGHGIMCGPAGSRHLVDVMAGAVEAAGNRFRLDRVFEPRELDIL